MTEPVLELIGLGLERGGSWPVHDVDLRLMPGGRVGLIGPSGSGKSTLLRLILGLEVPSAGTVRIDGRSASSPRRLDMLPEDRGLAMIFQDLALWPHMTVMAHLEFVLAAAGVASRPRRERAAEAVAWVDLRHCAGRRPASLSGGERRRLAIARALVVRPRLLLLDEPMANLDIIMKRELLELLGRMVKERELSMIHVTHEPREAVAISDGVAVMERGTLARISSWAILAAEAGTPFMRAMVEDLAG